MPLKTILASSRLVLSPLYRSPLFLALNDNPALEDLATPSLPYTGPEQP
jgi:hypothetical protein